VIIRLAYLYIHNNEKKSFDNSNAHKLAAARKNTQKCTQVKHASLTTTTVTSNTLTQPVHPN